MDPVSVDPLETVSLCDGPSASCREAPRQAPLQALSVSRIEIAPQTVGKSEFMAGNHMAASPALANQGGVRRPIVRAILDGVAA